MAHDGGSTWQYAAVRGSTWYYVPVVQRKGVAEGSHLADVAEPGTRGHVCYRERSLGL
jgi:hypothetical protein